MISRRRAIGLSGLAAAVALAGGCGLFGKSITYRYRLTVVVNTPQGIRTGSSVIQVDLKEQNGLQGSHVQTRKAGDAVAVDLPGGKTLFALLDGSPVTGLYATLQDKFDWYARAKALKNMEGVHDVPRTVPNFRREQVDIWPTLVTFGDIADPTTVVRVDPDNAAATLGEGMRIRRVTVEMTNDNVTTGIAKRFPWWSRYRDLHFDGTSTVSENMQDKKLTAHLTSGSFSTEYRK